MGASWIVMDFKTSEMVCKRCGETYPIKMPISVDMFCGFSKVFIKEHRRCKEKACLK